MASRKAAPPSELRQDIVSGDWVAIATARARRPQDFLAKKTPFFRQSQKACPFETLHKDALVSYIVDRGMGRRGWEVQVIPNKYPAFAPESSAAIKARAPETGTCAIFYDAGPYRWTQGIGFHEVVITRDHERSLALMGREEVELAVRAYAERSAAIARDSCVRYISVFHNHGSSAGASLSHPHSQIIALPVIPPDVARSVRGSKEYFTRHTACVHCAIVTHEIRTGERIIYENDHCAVIAPYASKTAFEMRIFPKKHRAHFDESVREERDSFADALRVSLAKLFRGIGNPDYNFFVHTAPVSTTGEFSHYHWHAEILPKTAIWAGFEIGTGIEISTIAPERAAAFLKKVKV